VSAPSKPKTAGAQDGSNAKDAKEAKEAPPEPRIIRGNDQVIAAPKAAAPLSGGNITFNFEDAPVAEVVRTILGDILKVDYALHPPISGTVTLATRAPITPDQAAFLLESALQASGLALVRDARGSYHVGRPDALKGIAPAVRQSGKDPLPPGYGVVVVPLQYIGASEMATILRPLLTPDALVRVDNVRNLLVLAGTRTQAEGWLDLINTFDVDLLKGMSVGLFPLKYASVKEVEAALQLMSPGAGAAAGNRPAAGTASGGASAGAAAATAAAGEGNYPLFGALRILPIERLNSILVVTPRAAYLDEARRWIEKFDRPSDTGSGPQLFVYPVQNGSARHLADVLKGIFGDAKQSADRTPSVAPGLKPVTTSSNFYGGSAGAGSMGYGGSAYGTSGLGTGGFGSNPFTTRSQQQPGSDPLGNPPTAATLGNVRVMADEVNNAVLVWGTRDEYTKIESTLKRLDVPAAQVQIEANIVEVTLTNDLQYGLEWAFTNDHGKNTGVLSSQSGGTLGGQNRGFSYTLTNSLGQVRAVLNLLADKSLVKVLSSPTLMVLDNHTATINVGTQQPVQAGETLSQDGNLRTTNIQYKDTGVSLVVTPSINAGNIVNLQVDQTVTDVGQIDQATGQRAFLQRQIGSQVAVRSGESLVLGGLIRDNTTVTKSGIPVLQDIPVVGNLFSTNSKTTDRTELVVIITPRVVRSDQELRDVGKEMRERLQGLQKTRIQDVGYEPVEPPPTPPPAILN
jgi:general secretion pathway protein D